MQLCDFKKTSQEIQFEVVGVKQCPPFSAALARRRRASRASHSLKEVSGEGTRVGAVGRRRTGGVEEDRGGHEDGLGDEVEDGSGED